jgi:FkbM family methyltransferase
MSDLFINRLSYLRDTFNFYPNVIYDIGAHEGTWTEECKRIFNNSLYFQFEADTDKKSFLKKDISFFYLLGDTDDKEIDYFKIKTQFTTGNSVFRENSHHYTTQSNYYIEKRYMKKLDTVVVENNIPFPDFIKIDTQGSELLILKGATECLKNVKIILLEVSIHEYNKNGPLIYDVLHFMKENGFLMFDIIDNHYIKNVLAQVDILFCKHDSEFLLHSF